MYKPNMTAAVAALLIATAPLAYAQTAPHVTTVAATSTLSGIIQPDQIRASQMIGSSVYSVQNVDISKVRDLILPWRPVWARVPTPIPHRVSNTVPRSGGVVSQPGGFSCWRLHRREPSSEDFRM